MPAAQVINLNAPEGEPSALKRTADSFSQRFMENKERQRESDALKEIYEMYQDDSQMLQKSNIAIQKSIELSPTTKVNTVNQNLQMQKYNQQLQNEALKRLEKEKKEQDKIKIEQDLDEKEIAYLESIKGKNLTPMEIYSGAAEYGLPRISRNRLSNLTRMEGREARLTQKDISEQYNFEMKELSRQIKELNSEKKKEPLRKKYDKLVEQRNSDLAKYRKGQRDFSLAMYDEEAVTASNIEQKVDEDIQEQEVDPFIQMLDKSFPVSQVPVGMIKYLPAKNSPDGKTHSYKSDGKKWIQIS